MDESPNHLKPAHGGKREGAGRPSVGTTRRVALTLPEDVWGKIDQCKKDWGTTQSQTLRTIIEEYWTGDKK